MGATCATCGRPAGPGRFCGECGSPLEPEQGPAAAGQRRQLAVLFCDVVESTPLSQRLDAEEFGELMLAFQRLASETIEGFGGQRRRLRRRRRRRLVRVADRPRGRHRTGRPGRPRDPLRTRRTERRARAAPRPAARRAGRGERRAGGRAHRPVRRTRLWRDAQRRRPARVVRQAGHARDERGGAQPRRESLRDRRPRLSRPQGGRGAGRRLPGRRRSHRRRPGAGLRRADGRARRRAGPADRDVARRERWPGTDGRDRRRARRRQVETARLLPVDARWPASPLARSALLAAADQHRLPPGRRDGPYERRHPTHRRARGAAPPDPGGAARGPGRRRALDRGAPGPGDGGPAGARAVSPRADGGAPLLARRAAPPRPRSWWPARTSTGATPRRSS